MVFTVSECIPRFPPVYKLKDYDREPIEGSFYKPELQKVKKGSRQGLSSGGNSKKKYGLGYKNRF